MIVLPNMGLYKWNGINDFFSHEQLAANFATLDEHDHTTGKGKQITAGGIAENAVEPKNLSSSVYTQIGEHLGNESILTANLKANAVTSAKILDGTITRADLAAEAKPITWYTPTIIATEQTRENTAFATLSTPDEITGVVLPTNGLIVVGYSALVKSSSSAAGRIAIFLGSNQIKSGGTPTVQEVATQTTELGRITSSVGGLAAVGTAGADVTTGQVLGISAEKGGQVVLFAAAGTYTVSVQFKATTGSITAKERKLFVATLGF